MGTVAGVDTVVIAVSRVPNDGLYEEVKDSFKEVRRLGDALAPRRTAEVIYEGETRPRAVRIATVVSTAARTAAKNLVVDSTDGDRAKLVECQTLRPEKAEVSMEIFVGFDGSGT